MARFKGIPVFPGVAQGPAFVFTPYVPRVGSMDAGASLSARLLAYRQLQASALEELSQLSRSMRALNPEEAAIFAAQQDIINDVSMDEELLRLLEQMGLQPDEAIDRVYTKYAAMLAGVQDPLIRERADDILDARLRLLRLCENVPEVNLAHLTQPCVVVAKELLPSHTAGLAREFVLGIATEQGGATSHTAIIARSYEIPALVGVSGLMGQVTAQQPVLLDALEGQVVLDPTQSQLQSAGQRRTHYLHQLSKTGRYLKAPAKTADGQRLEVGANLGSPSPAGNNTAAHADFVGLLRTEFLFLNKNLPGEEKQYAIYREKLEQFAPRPVLLRTLDVGADKTLPAIPMPAEENPALGSRALRLCFAQPELFTTQLRAALRASEHGNLWLMLPMATSLEDVRRAKAMVHEAVDALRAEGLAVSGSFKLGVMLEVPSLALMADTVAKEVDFASFGTNDLTQYLLAADRSNPHTAGYYQPLHPALFRLMDTAIQAFNREGKTIGICGELAANPLALPVLVGLGLRRLSVEPTAIATVKQALSTFTMEQARRAAKTALQKSTAREVEQYLRKNFPLHATGG